MYICLAPGLRLNDGKVAVVGAEIPEARDWPHHIVDMHIRNGKIRYEGKPEDRVSGRAVKPPERPKFNQVERERLANLPHHQRELMATRRGWPAHWLHEPEHGPEAEGGGVQLTEEQRQAAYREMPAEIVAMAAKARGTSVEALTGGKKPVVPKADAEPAKTETAPAGESAKKAKGK